MSQRMLIDTGPLISMLDNELQHHQVCASLIRSLPPPFLTCWPVITEAMWMVRHQPGNQERLLDAFNTGLLQLLPLDESAVPAISALLKKYQSLRPQLADVCLVHLADRENIRTIFTLDRRDFSVYRFRGKQAFRLIPEL